MDTKAYWESRLTSEYSLLGVGDITLGLDYNRWLYRIRGDVFRRIARWRWPDSLPSEVLDVGSGTGFYLDHWNRLGIDNITGSDLTDTAVAHLSQNFPSIAVQQLDISSPLATDLTPGSFEAVSAFDVLFHIVDDEAYTRAIGNISTLLKPGGTFIYSDNFMPSDQRIAHQTSRTWDSVKKNLDGAGLRIVGRFPMFVFMNDPVRSRSRILHRLFRYLTAFVRKGEQYGNLAGAALYLPERLLTKLLSTGPSTEILVCEKVES